MNGSADRRAAEPLSGEARMWCTRCHADVAAELAENGQALHCASCGHEIQKIYTPSLHPETRSARELLERWSREERITPPPPPIVAPANAASPDSPASTAADNLPPFRKDLDPLESLAPPSAAASSPGRSSGSDPNPPRLISTNIATAPSPQAPPLPAPEPAPVRDSVPPQPAPVPAAESTPQAAEAMSRRKPERPATLRAPKAKGIWRADSAHVPSADGPGDDVPNTVAALESIGAQPSAPPLPVRQPRANFAAVAASIAADSSVSTTPSPAPPAFGTAGKGTSESRSIPSSTRHEAAPSPSAIQSETRTDRAVSRSGKKRRRIDAAQSHSQPSRPHFDLQTYLEQNPHRVGRSETLWGQLVAYAGVAVLTIGTTTVLWGYFGGLGQYTSTGFLISTAGQMLLFLGVVTLVSGGMQQTSHEVATRVEYLGDRMIRMEQATQQVLRSPHFARRRNHRGRSAEIAAPLSESSDAA